LRRSVRRVISRVVPEYAKATLVVSGSGSRMRVTLRRLSPHSRVSRYPPPGAGALTRVSPVVDVVQPGSVPPYANR
jgi:hypothetical protein